MGRGFRVKHDFDGLQPGAKVEGTTKVESGTGSIHLEGRQGNSIGEKSRGKPKKKGPRSLKQQEIYDWIENIIVPALVDKYIEEVLKREGSRG